MLDADTILEHTRTRVTRCVPVIKELYDLIVSHHSVYFACVENHGINQRDFAVLIKSTDFAVLNTMEAIMDLLDSIANLIEIADVEETE